MAESAGEEGSGRVTNQATVNYTSTVNITNVGQVIQVKGDNNTIVLSGNTVTQQTQNLTQNQFHPDQRQTTSTTTSSATNNQRVSPNTSNLAAQRSSNSASSQPVRYAEGPPNGLELITLMNKLTGVVGSNWKLLAGPLSVDDADINSIDHDEKTLKQKIHKLLKIWVEKDEKNDRTLLAKLLEALPGYDLAKACSESLKKIK